MVISYTSFTIGIVAGEISGDMLGAGLISTLKNYLPNAHFVGIAGPKMKETGMEVWYDIEELSVIGMIEIIKYLPKLFLIRRDLIRRFSDLKPDVFIGIDSPEFTITLEHALKMRGIRTIHYVSPSIWAWRYKRIFKIKNATHNILTLFPFEKALYDYYNIPCKFVGHALADVIPIDIDKKSARKKLGISDHVHCLALLPGSRKYEIEMLSANFLLATKQIKYKFPDLEIIVPLVNVDRRIQFEKIKAKIQPTLPIKLVNYQLSHQAMIAADVSLLASGTATLECMLAKCPMVVGYRIQPITFFLIRKFIRIPWISIPNILAERELVTELLQNRCQPDLLAYAVLELLNNYEKRKILLNTFQQLHKQIKCNANERSAYAILEILNCV